MGRVHDDLIRGRLAVQRLSSEPLEDPVAVVRQLLCVQAQDAPLARYSLGLRLGSSSDEALRPLFDAGEIIRTHILRPTWHFVAREDLRWIVALTSAKVESSLGSRNRQLGLDEPMIEAAHERLTTILAGNTFLTARDIIDDFGANGQPKSSESVRHLLLLAELRGLICSGPPRERTHTYGLVEDVIPPGHAIERSDAIRAFVRRFFVGRGPGSERDLRRWTTLTLTEIRNALGDLDGSLDHIDVDGERIWFDPQASSTDVPTKRALLLPTLDEAYLPYRSAEFPRYPGHPRGEDPHAFAEAGGGVVIVDRHDAGWWKRIERGRGAMQVSLAVATALSSEQRDLVLEEAAALAQFFDRSLDVEWV